MGRLSRHTLDNGLRLVHHHDPGSVMSVVDVIYNVGARDESRELTGIAHLFEHLMFGGSVNVSDFDAEVERAGGSDNAWTNNDFTNFYTVVPTVNIDTAFRVESDRMLALTFSKKALEVQRGVVIEEFKETCLNQPYGDLSHHLRELVYGEHPYSWPTIGLSPDHIARVTDADVRHWFYSHYAPNNAVLAVSGGIGFNETVELADRWFGPIPRREIAPRKYAPPVPVSSPRKAVVTGPVPQTVIVLAWQMPGIHDPDYKVCDLISDVLSNGMSSRFYRRLLMGTDLFTDIDAYISGSNEPGMFIIQARLRSAGEESERCAEAAIRKEIEILASEDPDWHEVIRAINKFESNLTFGDLNNTVKAINIAQNEISGIDQDDLIAAYRTVTPGDLRRVAAVLLTPERCCTLIYRPESY